MGLMKLSTIMPITGSGLPKDVTVNTWWFTIAGSEPGSGEITDAVTKVQGFWEFDDGGTLSPIGQRLAGYVNRNVTFRVVGVNPATGLEIGFPIEIPITLPPGPSGSIGHFPPEVAVCLSYHANYDFGVNKARRRGRLYLGPVDTSFAGGFTSDTVVPFIVDSFRQQLCDAARDVVAAPGDAVWSVYSRTSGAAYTVVGGWVDEEFDTQRRRGIASTIRTSWSAA